VFCQSGRRQGRRRNNPGRQFHRRGWRYYLHIRDKTVSAAGNRLYERGGVGRIAQGLTDLADRRVDAGFDIDEHVLSPEPVDDLAPEDQLAPARDEEEEQVHRLALQPHEAPAAAQLVRGGVELELAEPERMADVITWHWRQHRRLLTVS
jgi:hypothetical protein